MEKKAIRQKLRKILINKYAITLYIFLAIYIFVGDQSWINQIGRAKEIRDIECEIETVKLETTESERVLNSLEHPDSLERFAREQYEMHAEGEVVYLVD